MRGRELFSVPGLKSATQSLSHFTPHYTGRPRDGGRGTRQAQTTADTFHMQHNNRLGYGAGFDESGLKLSTKHTHTNHNSYLQTLS